MTDFAAGQQQRFDFGRVISRTFGVMGRNFVAFAGLSLLLAGVPSALIGAASAWLPFLSITSDTLGLILILVGIVSFIVVIASTTVLQGALVHAAVTDLGGGKVSFGASLGVGLRFLLPLIGVAIITGIGIGIGFLLLIVPGVFLALMWCVVAPVIVVDRMSIMESLERSAALSKGHRWSILGLFLLYVILVFIVSVVFEVPGQFLLLGATGDMTTGLLIYFAVLSPLQTTITTMVGAAGVAALYIELRHIKEGVGAQTLAAVFE